ncbi:MAG: hypothetical protein KDC46_10340 [Thermoleophilia bacterium]|nr:hypothetical protein [Thermoleophilia bacterium]
MSEATEAVDDGSAGGAARRSLTEVLSTDELSFIVEPRREDRGSVQRIAGECEQAGASAISLSVDAGFGIDDLALARSGCTLPVIARGHVADAGRVQALRDAGADALMAPARSWIREATDEPQDGVEPAHDSLAGIVRAAHAAGMEVVLTVHDEDELGFAVDSDADVLNIDNRDQDGRVDVERTFDLLAQVPVGWPVISESIAALEQVAKLHRAGVDALLLDEGHLDTGLQSALAVYADASVDQHQ